MSFLFRVAEHNLQMGLVSGLESCTLLVEVDILLVEVEILLVGVKLVRSLLLMVGVCSDLVKVEVCSGLVKEGASVHSLKNLH